MSLPASIRFFDEISMTLYEAAVAWQRGREIGIKFLREIDPSGLSRAELFRLGSAKISRSPQNRMRLPSKRYGSAAS